jgi:hypothetical protein
MTCNDQVAMQAHMARRQVAALNPFGIKLGASPIWCVGCRRVVSGTGGTRGSMCRSRRAERRPGSGTRDE